MDDFAYDEEQFNKRFHVLEHSFMGSSLRYLARKDIDYQAKPEEFHPILDTNTLSQRVWGCCELLLEFIAEHSSEFRGKTVLELVELLFALRHSAHSLKLTSFFFIGLGCWCWCCWTCCCEIRFRVRFI
jgi:hypothetical protein